jgi:hypothetical protein
MDHQKLKDFIADHNLTNRKVYYPNFLERFVTAGIYTGIPSIYNTPYIYIYICISWQVRTGTPQEEIPTILANTDGIFVLRRVLPRYDAKYRMVTCTGRFRIDNSFPSFSVESYMLSTRILFNVKNTSSANRTLIDEST